MNRSRPANAGASQIQDVRRLVGLGAQRGLIDRAIERASAATGPFFETEGSTDRRPFTDAAGAERPRTTEAIVLHEIAHIVGLDHVNEPTELMAARNSGQVELGPGDREDLARLGSLPCS